MIPLIILWLFGRLNGILELIMVAYKDYRFIALVCCWALVTLVFGGCGGSVLSRRIAISDLDDRSPTVRIRAIKWAGENRIEAAVPKLVDFLEDEDASVRFYAIEGLRRITGDDNGYDYKASAQRRAASVDRWREFLKTKEWHSNGR